MHGYFMDMKLYHKVKAIVEPFAYEEYRKNKIREKIEEQRATRIRQKVKLHQGYLHLLVVFPT